MMIGGPVTVTTSVPRQPPKMPSVGEVITDRRFSALSNVLVFTPYAIYLARGKKPPGWLIAASLTYLAVSFFEDMRYLIQGEQVIESQLSRFPPDPNGCGCQNRPPATPQSFTDAMHYRVNR